LKKGQSRAAENAKLHGTLHNQRQGDNILPAAKQALRAVNGIQRPESPTSVPAASIDPVQNLTGAHPRIGLPHEVDDTGRQLWLGAECRCVFFGN
jgi:hypothetical protein